MKGCGRAYAFVRGLEVSSGAAWRHPQPAPFVCRPDRSSPSSDVSSWERPLEKIVAHRVLHILGSAQVEGAGIARIVGALAKGLDPQEYVLEACFLDREGPLAEELQAQEVGVRTAAWSASVRDPVGAWRFVRGLDGARFSLVHQHYGGRSVSWLARRATGARLVLHVHGRVLETHSLTPSAIRLPRADAVIAASRAVAQLIVGARPRAVYACASGGEQRPARPPAASSGAVIGTACRLAAVKGLVYLVRAFALLRGEFEDARLEIAGSGPELSALEREIHSLGLDASVALLGWQGELPPLLRRWDVFVLPSLDEALGIAALEAMAHGLPVVASAVGGLPELVEQGRTGWLVPPADPTALAERLRWMLLNAPERLAMGTAAQARARRCFSTERMVRDISQVYGELLAGRAN